MELELTLLDDNNQPIALVQRFTGDKCTLMVSKYGVPDGEDLTTSHNSTMNILETEGQGADQGLRDLKGFAVYKLFH